MSEESSSHDSEMLVPLNRRNYILAAINGVVSRVGGRLMDLRTVLPLLLVRLTGQAWMVGLLETMAVVARVVPELIASRWVDTLDYKLPYYARYSVVRFLALLALAGSVLAADFIPNVLVIVLFFVFFTARYLAQGVSSLCFQDIIAKSVPTTRRGSLWMWRWAGGITMIFVVAVPAIRYFLGDNSPVGFPQNYGVLLAGGAVVLGIAWFTFSQINEPEGSPALHTLTPAQHVVRGFRIWGRDAKFRHYVLIRMFLRGAGAIRPFLIAFGAQIWGLPDVVAATFVTIEAISQGLGAMLGGQLSDRLGNRAVLFVAGSAILLTSLGALLIAQFVPDVVFEVFGYQLSYRVIALGVCFVGGGAFTTTASTGHVNYMLDIAPERMRPSYLAFARLFAAPAGFLPLAFGWAVDAISYQFIFGAGAVFAALSVYLAFRIDEPRDELDDEEIEEFR